MKLNQIQKDVLFGGLLGDLSLQTYSNGNSWRVRCLQKRENLAYVIHISETFSEFVKTPAKIINDPSEALHKVTLKNYSKAYFNTLVGALAPVFKEYGAMFYELEPCAYLRTAPYKNGKSVYSRHKKVLPSFNIIYEALTPRAIAYWFMDDGSYKTTNKSIRFCTESFTLEENIRLCEVLKKRYNWKVNVIRHNKSYRIAMSKTSFESFKDTIEIYVLPLFKYKSVALGNI